MIALKGKEIKVELLFGVILALIAIGAGGLLVKPAYEPDMTLKARFGDVAWNHEHHARMQEMGGCTVCHHKDKPGETSPRACRDCHPEFNNQDAVIMADLFMDLEEKTYSGENGPPAMKAFHGKCMGCHKAMERGPSSCRDCHEQTFSGEHGLVEWDHRNHARFQQTDCVTCHHKDTEAKSPADYRSCSVCHEPAQIKGLNLITGIEKHEGIKHGDCSRCHTEKNPEDDLRTCDNCHPGMGSRSSDDIPCKEQAIHNRCLECHNLSYDGLVDGMPTGCVDCHKRDPSMLNMQDGTSILWNHKLHSKFSDTTCDVCHHAQHIDEPKMACSKCHDSELYDNPSSLEAMNICCVDCHVEKGIGLATWDGLTGQKADLNYFSHEIDDKTFWWSHRFHAVSASISCRDCHHNTIKDSEDWAKKDSSFQSCVNCHAADNAQVKNDNPDLKESLEKTCIECHKRHGCGPVTWDELFKNK